MGLTLHDILPTLNTSLEKVGFLFGAGTSREAGYPMMPELTAEIIAQLTSSERSDLDEVLTAKGAAYDASTRTPNIEEIADYVLAHWMSTNQNRFDVLKNRLRDLLLERILDVKTPSLDNHCRFFDALKKRVFGLRCPVWIFTTNYDTLIETAAARCGVTIENGFSGTTERFFDPSRFKSQSGEVAGRNFHPNANLTVKLVKLHGSISWTANDSKFFERHPEAISVTDQRVMILPRRRKVMDTLSPPYDTLFSHANKAIGSECKYLVSCGFSFGDQHINEHLLLPALIANKCRLFALCQTETPGIKDFKHLPTFSAGYESHCHMNKTSVVKATDAWKFSKFVSLFESGPS